MALFKYSFLLVFLSLSLSAFAADTATVKLNGTSYSISLNSAFADFEVRNASNGALLGISDLSAAEYVTLYSASQSLDKVRSFSPDSTLNQLDNSIAATVSRMREDPLKAGKINAIEQTSSILTSAAIALIGAKATTVACGKAAVSTGGGACLASASITAKAAWNTFGDSAVAAGLTIQDTGNRLNDEINAFNSLKTLSALTRDISAEFETLTSDFDSTTIDIDDIETAVVMIDEIQSNSEVLANAFNRLGRVGEGSAVDAIMRGAGLSVVSAVALPGVQTGLGALNFATGYEDINSISDLDNNILTSVVEGIYTPITLSTVAIQTALLESAAKQRLSEIEKQNEEQKAQEQALLLIAAIAALEDRRDEEDNLEDLEGIRASLWNDLRDLRNDVDDISDDIINASTLDELEDALDKANDEIDRAEFFEELYEDREDRYSRIIDSLVRGGPGTRVCIVECFEYSELSKVRGLLAEAKVLKEEFSDYVLRRGGLEDVYDSGRELRNAWREQEAKELAAEQARLAAEAARLAAIQAEEEANILVTQAENLALDVVLEDPVESPVYIAPEGDPELGFAANLVTGSPIFISQLVDTGDDPFLFGFDFLFEDEIGTLDVFLDDNLLGSLNGADFSNDSFSNFETLVDDSLLLSQTDIELKFLFDDFDAGTSLWLDNIQFPGLLNGTFDDGLTFWNPQGAGFAVATNFALQIDDPTTPADPPSTSVDEPKTQFLLIVSALFLIFVSMRKRVGVNNTKAA